MNGIEEIFIPSNVYNTKYASAALAFSLLLLGFAGHHYISIFLKGKLTKWDNSEIHFASTISQRITGFIFFGLVPLTAFYLIQNISLEKYGINIHNVDQSLIWFGILAPLIIFGNYYMAGKMSNLQNYPQIRIKNWNSWSLSINFVTWLIYLFAYEAFFRGLLLFSFYYTFGAITAIIVNILLYVLVHFPKGSKEMIGSVPFGLLLCIITLNTGSFLAAFLIHGIMATSYEFFSIKAHPEMSIKNKRL